MRKENDLNILVVSPHLDDETLGAGGTLLRYARDGGKLYWLNITNAKEEYGYSRDCVSSRTMQVEKVKAEYGIEKMWDLALKPAALKEYRESELIETITPLINEIRPDMMILPYEHDIHSDHAMVVRAMMPFTKPFRYPFVKKILAMEVVSETEYAMPYNGFVPNYFVDITDFIDKKVEIMQLYQDEIGEHPFPRNPDNVRALAHFRGATAGVRYAEAFLLLRWIESGNASDGRK
jgi:LmbE family N-acetylglucosaminyl deacetylase